MPHSQLSCVQKLLELHSKMVSLVSTSGELKILQRAAFPTYAKHENMVIYLQHTIIKNCKEKNTQHLSP